MNTHRTFLSLGKEVDYCPGLTRLSNRISSEAEDITGLIKMVCPDLILKATGGKNRSFNTGDQTGGISLATVTGHFSVRIRVGRAKAILPTPSENKQHFCSHSPHPHGSPFSDHDNTWAKRYATYSRCDSMSSRVIDIVNQNLFFLDNPWISRFDVFSSAYSSLLR